MNMAAVQQYCLRWNNHQPNFISMFRSLLNSESLVDVTLAAEGKHLQAHKVVLSACSSYFQSLFTLNPCQHPIVILKDINYQDLKVMVDFMYCGEVNVSQEQLPAILKTAETLKVKGLAEMPESGYSLTQSVSVSSCDSPTQRRKRLRKASTGSASGSGSTEHTGTVTGGSEETVGSVEIGPTVKTETEVTLRHEPSTESEPSQDDDAHSVRSVYTYTNTRDIKHEKGSFESQLSTESYHSPSASPASVVAVEQVAGSSMGSKRGRLLIRQNRIKRECEGEDPGVGPPTPQPSPNPNLLTVPQPSYLVKQHSSPSLLLSNNPAPSSPTTPTLQVQLVSPEAAPAPTPSIRVRTEELRRASSTPQSLSCGVAVAASEGVGTSRSCHCPVLRPGPALGCNFCWNTVDTHGRILRRKTKYHCPECQTNLCIVPCFQEYHERHNSSGGLDSTPVTGPVIPTIMKTSSMG